MRESVGLAWLKKLSNKQAFLKTPSQRKTQLKSIKKILQKLGLPQSGVKTIHLAGSKGKGSTALFIAATLRGLGYDVLLFTSPHIYDICERILFNLNPVDMAKWDAELKRIHSICATMNITVSYFDVLTILAFQLAREYKADFLVLETGIGGRLDTTNLCQPIASVITSIEKEHTQILGDSLSKIAREKAGIIKINTPTFVAEQTSEVSKVIKKIAKKQRSPAIFLDEIANLEITLHSCTVEKGFYFDLTFEGNKYTALKLAMPGLIQTKNALLALLVITKCCPEKTQKNIFLAWQQAIAEKGLPGRFEIMRRHPLIIFDGCHTPHSMQATLNAWQHYTSTGVLLFSCRADKDYVGMSTHFHSFSHIIITGEEPHMQEVFLYVKKLYAHTSFYPCEKLACSFILEHMPDSPLLVAGSFYLLQKVKNLLPRL